MLINHLLDGGREGPSRPSYGVQLGHTHDRPRGQGTRLCCEKCREYNSKAEGCGIIGKRSFGYGHESSDERDVSPFSI